MRFSEHLRGRVSRLAVATVLAMGCLALGAAAAVSPRWSEVASVHVSGDSNAIHALVATGPDDIWAFGEDLSSIPEWRVLGERWDGHTWTRLNMLDRETAPASDFLYGAAATGANNVWAVGQSATAQGNELSRDLIEHWDGSSWTIVDPHLEEGLSHGLSGVAVTARALWAVGSVTYRNGPDYVPLVYHRTSTGWASVPFTSAIPGCRSFWRGVLQSVVIDGSSVYASGWCQFENFRGPNGPQRGFIAQRTGGVWSLAYEVPLGDEVNALAVAPNGQIWAAGDTGTPGAQRVYGLLWRGTGRSWSRVAFPSGSGLTGRLNAVAATSSAVYVAGSYASATTGRDFVVSVDPVSPARALEPVIPISPASVDVGALVAPPGGGSPWLGGDTIGSSSAGAQAILAQRIR